MLHRRLLLKTICRVGWNASPRGKLSFCALARGTHMHVSTMVDAAKSDSLTTLPPAPINTIQSAVEPEWEQTLPHPGYNLVEITHLAATHREPSGLQDQVALLTVKAMRSSFDILSGYRGPGGAMTERDWLNRCVFLETVAGVPGMVAGMARHLRSLRGMRRDYGWIHTLLEEAENERMHLMIFVEMRQPSQLFRWCVKAAQVVFVNAFFLTYLLAPQTCHRFVGYLEEEAVKTYSVLLQDIADGHLPAWQTTRPPDIACDYYALAEGATVADVIQCVRADEAKHRDVNHGLADLEAGDANPLAYDVAAVAVTVGAMERSKQ